MSETLQETYKYLHNKYCDAHSFGEVAFEMFFMLEVILYDAEEEYVFMCSFGYSFMTERVIAYLYAIRLVYYGCFHWEGEGIDGTVALCMTDA